MAVRRVATRGDPAVGPLREREGDAGPRRGGGGFAYGAAAASPPARVQRARKTSPSSDSLRK